MGGVLDPNLIRFLGPSQSLKRHLDLFSSFFAGHIRVISTQTDRQTTLRATSVAIGRIYAMREVRPKMYTKIRQNAFMRK